MSRSYGNVWGLKDAESISGYFVSKNAPKKGLLTSALLALIRNMTPLALKPYEVRYEYKAYP